MVLDNGESSSPEEIRERSIKLFTYLREFAQLRNRVVRDVQQYDAVIWFSDVPEENECYQRASESHPDDPREDLWLEIKKPRSTPVPLIPRILEPWIRPADLADSSEIPELLTRLAVGEGPRFEELSEHPEIQAQWEDYLENHWLPWAAENERLKPVRVVYGRLHEIYQSIKKLGEAYELVVGVGLLIWKTPSGQDVRRHLITARASIELDGSRGTLTVGPAGEGAVMTLEQDMLDPSERPSGEVQIKIEDLLKAASDEVWKPAPVDEALSTWANTLSAQASYARTSDRGSIGPFPSVTFAPALILRKRTERGLVETFRQIIDQLRNGAAIPQGILRTVEIREDVGPFWGEPDELYFPLHSNAEQRKIVQQLARKQGVLVQGPPGTGKSHTIVNLICHLLATGKRVLVTSQTPRALKVLKGMIPKEMAALCVSLLGDDSTALKEMEGSVQGITDKKHDWDSERDTAGVAVLRERLTRLRREEAKLQATLREQRERETYEHRICNGAYIGTAQRLAERLSIEHSLYGWFDDHIPTHVEAPFSNSEALQLLHLHCEITPERVLDIEKAIPSPTELMSFEEFSAGCQAEVAAKETVATFHDVRDTDTYRRLLAVSPDNLKALRSAAGDLVDAWTTVMAHSHPWLKRAVVETLSSNDGDWRELLIASRKLLKALPESARDADERKISMPSGLDRARVRADAQSLLDHFKAGGRLGFPLVRPRVVKQGWYLMSEVRVNGRLCSDAGTLTRLLVTLDVDEKLDLLWSYWGHHVERGGSTRAGQVARLENLCQPLSDAVGLGPVLQRARKTCESIPGLLQPLWHQREEVERFLRTVDAVEAERILATASSVFDAMRNALRSQIGPSSHPVVHQALTAVESRDTALYGNCLHTLSDLVLTIRLFELQQHLHTMLKTHAPLLANALASTPTLDSWTERLVHFTESWRWAQANTWLDEFSDGPTEAELTVQVDRLETQIAETMEWLSSSLAWGHCLRRMRTSEEEHLRAWSHEMRKIGKGTGKRAAQHRRAARENLEQCRTAIPAWVMPLYRVAETVKPGVDAFDVVVIDEASQSRPDALFLQFIASKIVVVGDDKQISPENIGVLRDEVDALQNLYLTDLPIPHKAALGAESSFFDLANILFGGRIVLREHFRCMPEIIQFSNNLCYTNSPLVPLRQYPPNRLKPVNVSYVREGHREGTSQHAINRPEAEALVTKIVECCADPEYADRTFGVISLLGEAQAHLIETLLREALGPEEVERRQLVCGDAYAFQGDERDVVFLSMVAAPGETTMSALTSAVFERRFNVAASRARDQMWLFHTPTLNDFRNHECLRYKLLSYCLDPHVTPAQDGLDTQSLREEANRPNRSRFEAPKPFGSWFEVDVFLRISDRGYRVVPQFRLGGYRVDLAVEGMTARLAIECDGDHWHSSAEQIENDVLRERTLRRCGLTVWRVRGSIYYRDPDSALEGLWSELTRLRIGPDGKDISHENGRDSSKGGSQPEQERDPAPPSDVDSQTASYERPLPFPIDSYSPQSGRDVSSADLEPVVVAVLRACPNQSCTKESMTRRVLSHLGVLTRGTPRERFHRKVMRALAKLKDEGVVEEYTATNVRIRLVIRGSPS